MNLVSVIIPIYKVEDYMDDCVDSVCNQTYKNIEIILVDDGSPDNCPRKCDDWAEKDSRIKVVHQENRGLSGARNSGLRASVGDYILYVDSDDTIEPDTVDFLIKLIEETGSDIAVSTFRYSKNEKENSRRLSKNVINGSAEKMLRVICECGLWHAWGKLIKRELAIKCFFTEKLIYEDYENTPRLFVNAGRAAISMDGRYHYTVRDDSIMGERQKETSVDFAEITEQNLALYEKSRFSDDTKGFLYSFLFKQLVFNYNTTVKYSKNKNAGYLIRARDILKKEKKKWKTNDKISRGRRLAYTTIVSFHSLYDFIYTHTHK